MTSKKLVRGLFSGASLFALAVGAMAANVTSAHAAGTTINTPNAPQVLNPADNDFIEVTTAGSIVDSGFGIAITPGNSVNGDIGNDGLIDVDGDVLPIVGFGGVGIANLGTVEGDIINGPDGEILVGDTIGGGDGFFVGVLSFEDGDEGQAVINDGSIDVFANGTADNGLIVAGGVAVAGFAPDGYIATVDNGGAINVGAFSYDAGGSSSSVGFGAVAGAFGDVAVTDVVNDGEINVTADVSPVNAGDPLNQSGLAVALGEVGLAVGDTEAASDFTNTGILNVGATVESSESSIAVAGGFANAAFATDASSFVDNSGTVDVFASAIADGGATSSTALAAGIGGLQVAAGDASGSGLADFSNSGDLLVTSNAYAGGADNNFAIGVGGGLIQSASGDVAGDAIIDNSGNFDVAVAAIAGEVDANGIPQDQSAFAVGLGFGSLQNATSANDATATLTNSGLDDGTFGGYAVSVVSDAQATDQATSIGVGAGAIQLVESDKSGVATVDNSGDYSVDVLANAYTEGTVGSTATALGLSLGGVQSVSGDTVGSAVLNNSGTYNSQGTATAESADDDGSAAGIGIGVGQLQFAGSAASGSTANTLLDNSGTYTISGLGSGVANGVDGSALGVGIAAGYAQSAESDDNANADLINDGSIDILGSGYAEANGEGGEAVAVGGAIGGVQNASSADQFATANLDNNGSYLVTGDAEANALGLYGDATAVGFGVGNIQTANGRRGATADFANGADGSYGVDVDALATADDDADAIALGVGFGQSATSAAVPSNALATGLNDGTFSVTADATATGGDDVSALGLGIGGVQSASSSTFADTAFTNNGSYTVSGSGTSATDGDFAFATGVGVGLGQFSNGGDAGNSFTNSADGVVDVDGVASAAGVTGASSLAVAAGVAQVGFADESATNTLTNDGDLSVLASADSAITGATGTAFGTAAGLGALQLSLGENADSDASLTNTGSFAVGAQTTVEAPGENADAVAAALSAGAVQVAGGPSGDLATANFNNSGDFLVGGAASATAGETAVAFSAGAGVVQLAGSENFADVNFVNGADGNFEGTFAATATGVDLANATSVGIGGLQVAIAETNAATADLTNDGVIDVLAASAAVADVEANSTAFLIGQGQVAVSDPNQSVAGVTATNTGTVTYAAAATAEAEFADADASSIGFLQVALAEDADAALTNSGDIFVGSAATATGDDAETSASALGALQVAVSPDSATGDADTLFDNSGLYQVEAVAFADGGTTGLANATADGVIQVAVGSTATFTNTGEFTVSSAASAVGDNAQAGAVASGATLLVGNNPNETDPSAVDVLNTGDLVVDAFAEGADGATATASGINVFEVGDTGVEGEITNNGNLLVTAEAISEGAAPENAFAVGIGVSTDAFSGTIYNDGLIAVSAIGATAQATGIYVETLGGDPGTIVNDGGTIIARTLESTDGFETSEAFYLRGNAINVANTASPMTIDLLGGDDAGRIFGNILISDNDTVNVAEGTTYLNGVVAGPGDLNLLTGGNLVLVNDNISGPSGAVVDSFTQEDGSTLGLNITPDQAPFIVANNVSLDGDAVIMPEAGLYADTTVYEDVVASGSAINGEWDSVTSISPLLSPEAVFDGPNNIDLVVERVGFGDVAGLTKNQSNVGDGIESVYDVLYNGGGNANFANLVGNLFTLNGAQYANALNQLSGAEYAQQIQSALWSFRLLNNVVGERLRTVGPNDNCAITDYPTASADVGGSTVAPVADLYVPAPAPQVVCAPSQAQIWARATGQWSSDDGDANGPKYDQDTYAVYGGIDWGFSPLWKVGLTAGYISADMDFKRGNNKIDYDGLQVAGYGAYDNGVNYAHAILGYGHYSNDSRRSIGIGASTVNPFDQKPFGVQPDGVTDRLKGEWDSDVLSVYGETGYRYWVTPTASLTPFLALNYVKVWNDSFTESSRTDSGAALHVKSNDGESFNTQLGARLATQLPMGAAVISPELRLAWQHEWLDRYQTASANFAAMPGSNFSVVGTREGRDFAVVGAGATVGFTDALDFTVDYDGRFNGKHDDHSVVGRITYKF
ncbi:autotransporter domain-containing protein [Rhodoligotrophos ferricapiens]|uniref:autotransporter domain-containing protein n=1 Tax=Rhodoligotrophos ferricapiens TaxID=3069264 RepID=UPI00315D171F